MSYLGDLFIIFSLIFIATNYITSLKQLQLFFAHFLECYLLFMDGDVDDESEQLSNSERSA